jgi:hypothetical protein
VSLYLDLYDENDGLVVIITLLDVDPDPQDPDEGYFTTLDIESYNEDTPEEWQEFFEGLAVVDENGDLLTPDHGDIYLERLAGEFRGPYLNAVLTDE